MTTATKFSRQNVPGSRARTTWENLVLVVALVLESKGLYYRRLSLPHEICLKINLLNFYGENLIVLVEHNCITFALHTRCPVTGN